MGGGHREVRAVLRVAQRCRLPARIFDQTGVLVPDGRLHRQCGDDGEIAVAESGGAQFVAQQQPSVGPRRRRERHTHQRAGRVVPEQLPGPMLSISWMVDGDRPSLANDHRERRPFDVRRPQQSDRLRIKAAREQGDRGCLLAVEQTDHGVLRERNVPGGSADFRQQRLRIVLGVNRLREFDDRRQPLLAGFEDADLRRARRGDRLNTIAAAALVVGTGGRLAARFQGSSDRRQDGVGSPRLGNDAADPVLLRESAGLSLVIHRGVKDDRDVRQFRILVHSPHELVPVDQWHENIGNDQRRTLVPEPL